MHDSGDGEKDVRVHQRDDPGEHEALAVLPMNDSVHPDFSRARELISPCVSLGSPRLNAAVGSEMPSQRRRPLDSQTSRSGPRGSAPLVLAQGSTVQGCPLPRERAAAQRPATTRELARVISVAALSLCHRCERLASSRARRALHDGESGSERRLRVRRASSDAMALAGRGAGVEHRSSNRKWRRSSSNVAAVALHLVSPASVVVAQLDSLGTTPMVRAFDQRPHGSPPRAGARQRSMGRSISPSSAEIVLALLGRGQHGGERQAQRDPSRTSSDDRGPAPGGRLFAPSDRRWRPFIDRHLDLNDTSGDVAAPATWQQGATNGCKSIVSPTARA
jgi:hypothetical protein